jgi:hypothetical protein
MTTTTSARLMLRRGLAAAGQSTSTTGAMSMSAVRTKLPSPSIQVARVTFPHQLPEQNSHARRFFGGPANQIAADAASSPVVAVPEAVAHKYENLVEESIKKLMTTNNNHRESKNKNNTHEVEQLKPISNEDIEVRLQYFQVRSTCVRSWFLSSLGGANERIIVVVVLKRKEKKRNNANHFECLLLCC